MICFYFICGYVNYFPGNNLHTYVRMFAAII